VTTIAKSSTAARSATSQGCWCGRGPNRPPFRLFHLESPKATPVLWTREPLLTPVTESSGIPAVLVEQPVPPLAVAIVASETVTSQDWGGKRKGLPENEGVESVATQQSPAQPAVPSAFW
jgi:hypothetical protein